MVSYDKMGTSEIGEFVSRNIREYVQTTNEKNLTEIYKCLIIIGERVVREDYWKKVDSYILDDINHEAAADTVLAIMKDPEQFFIRRQALLRSNPTDRQMGVATGICYYRSW